MSPFSQVATSTYQKNGYDTDQTICLHNSCFMNLVVIIQFSVRIQGDYFAFTKEYCVTDFWATVDPAYCISHIIYNSIKEVCKCVYKVFFWINNKQSLINCTSNLLIPKLKCVSPGEIFTILR